jgi:glycosyltransferase involved in cell wall biosynthesis
MPIMKVALISPGWPRERFANGIVTSIADIIRPLQEQGIDPHVIAMRGHADGAENWVQILDQRGPVSVGDRVRKLLAPKDSFRRRTALDLAQAIEASWGGRSPEVLEIEESHGFAHHLRTFTRAAVVVTLHGPWFIHGPLVERANLWGDTYERARAEGAAIRSADALIAPSRDVWRRCVKYYGLQGKSAQIIPYCIEPACDERRWRLEESCRRSLVFVGRFDRHKGGDIVIDAFALLSRTHKQLRLVFIGPDRGLEDGEGSFFRLEEYVERRMPGALRAGQVEITGQLSKSDIEERRRGAIAVISASRWENLSLATLESMAEGCPLVVADAGGLAEHVNDGENGRLFRAGSPKDLAAKLASIVENPGAAARMGANAREYVAKVFSPAVICRQRMSVYAEGARTRAERGPE